MTYTKIDRIRKGDVILHHGDARTVTKVKRKYPKRGTYIYGFDVFMTLDNNETIKLPMGANVILIEKYRKVG